MKMNMEDAKKALEKSKKGYLPTCDIWHLADNVKSVLSTGNQTGEGWFLTAEMLEYMENGIVNYLSVISATCKNCGYVVNFSLKAMGLAE